MIVLNLLAGPGAGKSTIAAGVYYLAKMQGRSIELVREWVKPKAYRKEKIEETDQVQIFARQAASEKDFYHHVDLIVTDSPVLLSAYYEQKYMNNRVVASGLPEYMRTLRRSGITHLNFFLGRKKEYKQEGRYETEEQARGVDQELRAWLHENGYHYHNVDCPMEQQAQAILDYVDQWGPILSANPALVPAVELAEQPLSFCPYCTHTITTCICGCRE